MHMRLHTQKSVKGLVCKILQTNTYIFDFFYHIYLYSHGYDVMLASDIN